MSGWEILPLRGKTPLIAKRDGGRGVLDATSDVMQVAGVVDAASPSEHRRSCPRRGRHRRCRPPSRRARHMGPLTAEHGEFVTRTSWSGRGDGGRHLFVGHPGGTIQARSGRDSMSRPRRISGTASLDTSRHRDAVPVG